MKLKHWNLRLFGSFSSFEHSRVPFADLLEAVDPILSHVSFADVLEVVDPVLSACEMVFRHQMGQLSRFVKNLFFIIISR